MRYLKRILVSLGIMVFLSLLLLLVLSGMTYIWKWQADKALAGITIIYILAGYVGGFSLKRMTSKELYQQEISIGRKMLQGILLGSLFLAVLVLLSLLFVEIPFALSSRFLMIWMLLVGSASLGRII